MIFREVPRESGDAAEGTGGMIYFSHERRKRRCRKEKKKKKKREGGGGSVRRILSVEIRVLHSTLYATLDERWYDFSSHRNIPLTGILVHR